MLVRGQREGEKIRLEVGRKEEDTEMFVKVVYHPFNKCYVPKAVSLNNGLSVALYLCANYGTLPPQTIMCINLY